MIRFFIFVFVFYFIFYFLNLLLGWCFLVSRHIFLLLTHSFQFLTVGSKELKKINRQKLIRLCVNNTALLLSRIRGNFETIIFLYCDDLSINYIAANPVLHARTKPIELDNHFVHVKLGTHKVYFIPSIDQLADILTKDLSKPHFHFFRSKLVTSRPPSLAVVVSVMG